MTAPIDIFLRPVEDIVPADETPQETPDVFQGVFGDEPRIELEGWDGITDIVIDT